jgi:hypothetical protein
MAQEGIHYHSAENVMPSILFRILLLCSLILMSQVNLGWCSISNKTSNMAQKGIYYHSAENVMPIILFRILLL